MWPATAAGGAGAATAAAERFSRRTSASLQDLKCAGRQVGGAEPQQAAAGAASRLEELRRQRKRQKRQPFRQTRSMLLLAQNQHVSTRAGDQSSSAAGGAETCGRLLAAAQLSSFASFEQFGGGQAAAIEQLGADCRSGGQQPVAGAASSKHYFLKRRGAAPLLSLRRARAALAAHFEGRILNPAGGGPFSDRVARRRRAAKLRAQFEPPRGLSPIDSTKRANLLGRRRPSLSAPADLHATAPRECWEKNAFAPTFGQLPIWTAGAPLRLITCSPAPPLST